MDKGWIKLHRQLRENPFLRHDKNAFFVFVNLLIEVGYTKGQWSGSVRELAEQLEFNYNTLRSILNRLENQQIITQTSAKRYTVITICNWAKYQGSDTQLDTNATRTRHAHDTHRTEVPKEREKKKNIYIGFEDLEPELTEFIKMRKLIKSPMTPLAIERLVASVRRMYPDDNIKQRACLLQSVDHGWKGVFELKPQSLQGVRFA